MAKGRLFLCSDCAERFIGAEQKLHRLERSEKAFCRNCLAGRDVWAWAVDVPPSPRKPIVGRVVMWAGFVLLLLLLALLRSGRGW